MRDNEERLLHLRTLEGRVGPGVRNQQTCGRLLYPEEQGLGPTACHQQAAAASRKVLLPDLIIKT